jgi:hypothetical protein
MDRFCFLWFGKLTEGMITCPLPLKWVAAFKPESEFKRRRIAAEKLSLEKERHLLLLIVKFLHGLQHVATRIFFELFVISSIAADHGTSSHAQVKFSCFLCFQMAIANSFFNTEGS